MRNPRLPALHAHRVRDFVAYIGILEHGGRWVGRPIHKCPR
jgi:hypothetical protein